MSVAKRQDYTYHFHDLLITYMILVSDIQLLVQSWIKLRFAGDWKDPLKVGMQYACVRVSNPFICMVWG